MQPGTVGDAGSGNRKDKKRSVRIYENFENCIDNHRKVKKIKSYPQQSWLSAPFFVDKMGNLVLEQEKYM
ncbi:MAG: hypothetical protein PWQ70_1679 [Clostridiales bacterium]|jgi:hypothetical protein|nr:hypothetical protein [Clostridiales bacterium]